MELQGCLQERWAAHHPRHDQLHICIQKGSKRGHHLHSGTACLQLCNAIVQEVQVAPLKPETIRARGWQELADVMSMGLAWRALLAAAGAMPFARPTVSGATSVKAHSRPPAGRRCRKAWIQGVFRACIAPCR